MKLFCLSALSALVLAGCAGSGGGSDNSWSGSVESIPSGLPIPGGSGDFALSIVGEQVSGTCTISSRWETGSVSGTIANGILNMSIDFPTSKDWVVRADARYQNVSFGPSSVSGQVFVDSEEFVGAAPLTVHVYLGQIDIARE